MICIVTHTLPPEYGGADIAAFRYFQYLNANLIPSILIGYRSGNNIYENTIGIKKLIPSPMRGYTGIILNYIYQQYLKICLLLIFFRYKNEISLVHSFNSASEVNVESIGIAKFFGIPVISEISLMGSDDPCTLLKHRQLSIRSIFKRKYQKYLLLKKVDAFIPKSEFIADQIKECLPELKIQTVPYFVDQSKFRPAGLQERIFLRNKLNISLDRFCIIYAGGINPRKGVDLLVNAFLQLKREYSNLFLLLVGPTHKYDEGYVSNIFERLDNEARNDYMATKDVSARVNQYLKVSDLFVLPSHREGFPISVLEAMSTRLPVVCSDIPEIRDVQIKDGINGGLFNKGKVDSLVEVIKNLIEDKSKRDQLAIKAYQEAIAKYGLSTVYNQYKAIYSKITRS